MSKPNGHHVLFPRSLWIAQEPSAELRQNTWLIPPLDLDVHNELHKKVTIVPAIGYIALDRISREFEPCNGNYEYSIINLMTTIFEVSHDRHFSKLERELGDLTIEALRRQIPFIKEGLLPEIK